MHIFLETDRIALRQFTDTDADAALLLELDSDPEVMRYIGPFGLASIPAYRERIRTNWLRYPANPPARGVWAAIEKRSGQFIGYFFLRPAIEYRYAIAACWTQASDLELGYRLRRASWGQGLATETATALVQRGLADPTVSDVVACSLIANRGSTRVMEKAGLQRIREFMVPIFSEPCVMYSTNRSQGA